VVAAMTAPSTARPFCDLFESVSDLGEVELGDYDGDPDGVDGQPPLTAEPQSDGKREGREREPWDRCIPIPLGYFR